MTSPTIYQKFGNYDRPIKHLNWGMDIWFRILNFNRQHLVFSFHFVILRQSDCQSSVIIIYFNNKTAE